MASAGLGAPAAAASVPASAPHAHPSRAELATAAWLCAIPCALVALAAGYLLGPALGRLLTPASGGYTFLPNFVRFVHPEPAEHARYLIAACVPFAAALVLASSPRWLARVPARAVGPAVIVAQLVVVAVVLASIAAQYRYTFGATYTNGLTPPFRERYFSPATLVAAAAIAALLAAAARTPRARERAATLLRERWRLPLLAAAAALTALWMLHAVYTDSGLTNAPEGLAYHLGFTLDETFAVLNGRTPLVDFTAQYGSLWPFALALPMLAFGKTALTFTIVLCAITTLALLGVYGVLRRASGSSLAALLLYLPFLATSLFLLGRGHQYRSTPATYYANFPLRYALPLLLAWLTARALERGGGRAGRTWPLFAVAGIALINNGDFGVAALAATVAALLFAGIALERRSLARLAGAVVAGLALAGALVALLTLARAGALPQPGRWSDYARLYAVGGFALMPMPGLLGVHLLLYLTYAAAIVVAAARALRGAPNRVLTGMLAWSGVFGLGAGLYWLGRSHPAALAYEFSAWAFALALLTIVAVGELAAPRLRRTAIGALVVLFGFGVAACSVAQLPTPWEQVARLKAPPVPTEEQPVPSPLVPPRDAKTRRFVVSLADGPSRFVVKRGAPVAIVVGTGHRVADAYGVVNVSPYTGTESLETVERVEATLDALRDAGGNTAILPDPLPKSIVPLLERRGFELLTVDGLRRIAGSDFPTPVELPWTSGLAVMKWVDTRHLHPRALR
jgi:hypothetical protein